MNISQEIKNQIKMRLGGILYDEVKRSFKIKDYHGDLLKETIYKKRKQLFAMYFGTLLLARKTRDRYGRVLWDTLCTLYTDSSDQTLFNFNGILLSKPVQVLHQNIFALEIQDFLIYYLIEDKNFCDAATREGPYEIGEVKLVSGDVVIDCGANFGLFSAIAGRKGAVSYAFEPNRILVDSILSKTASLNPNINICEYALSDKRKEIVVRDNVNNIGAGRVDYSSSGEGQVVQAISLDEFVHESNINRVDFIKADIEGAERYMVKGAKNVLREFAPKIAICTYHLPDDSRVLRELILDANPKYMIEEKFYKMYAHVPK